MKEEKNEDVLFVEEFLRKNNLVHPISEDDQKFILKSEKKVLVRIYKSTGRYTPFLGLCFWVMYAGRPFRVRLSLEQSAVISVFLIALFVLCTGALAWFIIKHFQIIQSLIPNSGNFK